MPDDKPLKVLLVEDNIVDLDVVERWLTRSKRLTIDHERVTSLAEAQRRILEAKFQVILLDLKLPDSEGVATIESITECAPDAAVVVLTQTDDEVVIDRAFTLGVQDYLVKGRFDGEMLIRSIRYSHERKSMTRQVFRSQRMEGIGALACGIAHDINNVLSPVMMTANMLRTDANEEDINDSAEALEACAHRGANLVKQLLTFGRGMDGNRQRVDLRPLVKEILKISCETFPKNIRLDFDLDLWNVIADPTQMHQVLLNLVINSRDAMPDGGLLRVTVRNSRRSQAMVADGPGQT